MPVEKFTEGVEPAAPDAVIWRFMRQVPSCPLGSPNMLVFFQRGRLEPLALAARNAKPHRCCVSGFASRQTSLQAGVGIY
jgi:hypothetical protein